MKIIIDGQTFENQTCVRIEVAPEGETIGPFRVEIVGGPLTVLGKSIDEPAFVLDHSGLEQLTYETGCLDFSIESPPLVMTNEDGSRELSE